VKRHFCWEDFQFQNGVRPTIDADCDGCLPGLTAKVDHSMLYAARLLSRQMPNNQGVAVLHSDRLAVVERSEIYLVVGFLEQCRTDI